MFDFMGFARPLDAAAPLLEPGRLSSLWAPVVHLVAAGLGLALDRVDDSVERWPTPVDYEVAIG